MATVMEILRKTIGDTVKLNSEIVQGINPETGFGSQLPNDLDLDSLDVVEITMAVEDEFGIKINDRELPKNPKVSDILAIIENSKGYKADDPVPEKTAQ